MEQADDDLDAVFFNAFVVDDDDGFPFRPVHPEGLAQEIAVGYGPGAGDAALLEFLTGSDVDEQGGSFPEIGVGLGGGEGFYLLLTKFLLRAELVDFPGGPSHEEAVCDDEEQNDDEGPDDQACFVHHPEIPLVLLSDCASPYHYFTMEVGPRPTLRTPASG